jgi:hypothetical protein
MSFCSVLDWEPEYWIGVGGLIVAFSGTLVGVYSTWSNNQNLKKEVLRDKLEELLSILMIVHRSHNTYVELEKQKGAVKHGRHNAVTNPPRSKLVLSENDWIELHDQHLRLAVLLTTYTFGELHIKLDELGLELLTYHHYSRFGGEKYRDELPNGFSANEVFQSKALDCQMMIIREIRGDFHTDLLYSLVIGFKTIFQLDYYKKKWSNIKKTLAAKPPNRKLK